MHSGTAIDLSGFLASDPSVYGGWVTLADRRLPVARIGLMHTREGVSAAELARRWNLSMAQVHAALCYFFANREEIERQVTEYDAESDRLMAASSSPPG
jgi:uncharacterized protein (DUF433 family)